MWHKKAMLRRCGVMLIYDGGMKDIIAASLEVDERIVGRMTDAE